MKYTTRNETETYAVARGIASRLKGGDVLLLKGELGAGKTTFVKGLARALGIEEKIKSPTFTLIHQHRIKNQGLRIKHLVHCDAYRVKNARELMEAGLTDWLGRPDTLTVIEWGEKILPPLRERQYILIKFENGKGLNERVIRI